MLIRADGGEVPPKTTLGEAKSESVIGEFAFPLTDEMFFAAPAGENEAITFGATAAKTGCAINFFPFACVCGGTERKDVMLDNAEDVVSSINRV